MFKKGDIAARVTTTVQHFGFGSGREPIKHHTIEIVRIASAAKDGRAKSYNIYANSPDYKVQPQDAYRVKWMQIGGDKQEMAARLFINAKSADELRFDSQDEAKNAICAA